MKSCKERITKNFKRRIATIRKLWELYLKDPDAHDDEDGNLYEFGLSFDYVPKETFKGQKSGYFNWQLSWGGPSDEFRFFVDSLLNVRRIEYWFLDWFDSAKINLSGKNLALLEEVWKEFLKEVAWIKKKEKI